MKTSRVSFVVIFLFGCLLGSAVGYRLFFFGHSDESILDLVGLRESESAVVVELPVIREGEQAGGIETLDSRFVLANAYRSRNQRAWELERLFVNMTSEEAPSIFAKILDTPAYNIPDGLIAPFFRHWGIVDGESALEAARGLDGYMARDALKQLFRGWAQSDVHAAWEAVQASNDLMRNENDWYRPVMREFAKEDPTAMINQINGDPSNRENGYFVDALLRAASSGGNYPELLKNLDRLEDSRLREGYQLKALSDWAAEGPESALSYIERIEDPEDADLALSRFLTGWVSSDRAATLDYVFENLGSSAVARSLDTVLRTALKSGSREENEALVAQLSESGLIENVRVSVVNSLTQTQPDIATRLADSYTEGQALVESDPGRPMKFWVREDFDGAYSYYKELESVDLKKKHLLNLTMGLTSRADGGTLMISLLESVPDCKERTIALEWMLYQAGTEHSRRQVSEDFLVGLELLTESESFLSETAEAEREKLFGPRK